MQQKNVKYFIQFLYVEKPPTSGTIWQACLKIKKTDGCNINMSEGVFWYICHGDMKSQFLNSDEPFYRSHKTNESVLISAAGEEVGQLKEFKVIYGGFMVFKNDRS